MSEWFSAASGRLCAFATLRLGGNLFSSDQSIHDSPKRCFPQRRKVPQSKDATNDPMIIDT
jgi:hypothetical protein